MALRYAFPEIAVIAEAPSGVVTVSSTVDASDGFSWSGGSTAEICNDETGTMIASVVLAAGGCRGGDVGCVAAAAVGATGDVGIWTSGDDDSGVGAGGCGADIDGGFVGFGFNFRRYPRFRLSRSDTGSTGLPSRSCRLDPSRDVAAMYCSDLQ